MQNTGEIKLNSGMGQFLYSISKNLNYKKYVETGTKNADGSTYCILKGLNERGDDAMLIGFETNKTFFNTAIRNLRHFPPSKVSILNKSLVSMDELPDWKIWNGKRKEDYSYNKDLMAAGAVPMISNLDVLLLDSGGWSRQAEWDKYKDVIKVIILDDTSGSTSLIKNELLTLNTKWKVLANRPDERNGWFAAEKI